MPITSVVYLVLGLLPFVAFGFATVKERIKAGYEIQQARLEEQSQCRVKIATVEKTINDKSRDTVQRAREAADRAPVVGNTPDELRRLCERSASCRDRKR